MATFPLPPLPKSLTPRPPVRRRLLRAGLVVVGLAVISGLAAGVWFVAFRKPDPGPLT